MTKKKKKKSPTRFSQSSSPYWHKKGQNLQRDLRGIAESISSDCSDYKVHAKYNQEENCNLVVKWLQWIPTLQCQKRSFLVSFFR